MDRRDFIKSGIAAGAATWAAGSLLESCAQSSTLAAPKYQGRRLVLISLDGGHDGLHAVAPKESDLLAQLRPKVYADTLNKGIDISMTGNTAMVLHRNLADLLPGIRNGDFGVISNVGLPLNEWNGSHFVSQDFWSMAEYEGNRNPTGIKGTGWIGRLLENPSLHIDQFQRTAIAIGDLIPLILQGNRLSGVAWPGLERAESQKDYISKWVDETPLLGDDAVYREMADMSKIYEWLKGCTPMEGFNASGLGRQLANTAAIIQNDLPFKIIKCSMGGFDTHSGQLEKHEGLYKSLSQDLGAFYAFLSKNKHLDQTLVVIYSEFGRTLYENSALGTEHGTAGSMYVMGGAGCLDEFIHQPFSLKTTKLPGTDQTEYLDHQIDFRDIFHAVQKKWLLA